MQFYCKDVWNIIVEYLEGTKKQQKKWLSDWNSSNSLVMWELRDVFESSMEFLRVPIEGDTSYTLVERRSRKYLTEKVLYAMRIKIILKQIRERQMENQKLIYQAYAAYNLNLHLVTADAVEQAERELNQNPH
jgi:hypothetical protein